MPPILIVGIDHVVARAREYLPVEDERNPFARGRSGASMPNSSRVRCCRSWRARADRARCRGHRFRWFVLRRHRGALHDAGEAGGIRAVADREPVALRGAAVLVRMSRRAKRWPSRVYLGVGTHETSSSKRNDDTVKNVLLLERLLHRARLGPKRLRLRVEEGAGHTESAVGASPAGSPRVPLRPLTTQSTTATHSSHQFRRSEEKWFKTHSSSGLL